MALICISKLGHHWFWLWVHNQAPSHYQNLWPKCGHIVNQILNNIFQCSLNQNTTILIQENDFNNVVCEMAVILSQPQCVNAYIQSWPGFSSFLLSVTSWNIMDILIFALKPRIIARQKQGGTCLNSHTINHSFFKNQGIKSSDSHTINYSFSKPKALNEALQICASTWLFFWLCPWLPLETSSVTRCVLVTPHDVAQHWFR